MCNDKEIYTGEVIWFSIKRGYGFISWNDKCGKKMSDMFIHYSGISMPGFRFLKAEQKVQFSIGKNNSGDDKAIDVEILKDA
jgi:CspA family cold shock protein